MKGEREKMNKSELIHALAEQKNLKIDEASQVIEALFGTIREALAQGNRIEIRGFGSFKVKSYGGYTGRNPKNGAIAIVKPKKLPFFRTGKELKNFINDKVTS